MQLTALKLKHSFALILLVVFFGCTKEQSSARTELSIPDLAPRAGEITADGKPSPSPEFQKAQTNVAKYRRMVSEHPENAQYYIQLAQIYMQEARVTGKHHEYLPVSDQLLEAALQHAPEDFDALVLKATNLMTYHQFGAAKALIEKAIAKNDHSSYAYGVLCDADVELGDYAAAVVASDRMNALRPDLRSYARASYLREIYGDRTGAIAAMKMAADAGADGQENREWALYNLGNIFLNMGKLDTAQFIFNGILEERPHYIYAMYGLSSVKAGKGDYAGAIEELVKASQLTPEHVLIEQLADLYLVMGQKDAAKAMEAKAIEAFMQHEKGGWNVDREYALFCANHEISLPEALSRSEKEYKRRPENIDALDTYAWCLYKNGRATEALPRIEHALRLKTQSATLHYHAAMIHSAVGDKSKAQSEIALALQQNPYLTPLYLVSARKLRSDGKV